MSSPLENMSELPLLQQFYHQESDAIVVERLTPEEEEPGVSNYEFSDLPSFEDAAEFDYPEAIQSDRASQSGDDEDNLYWGPREIPVHSTDHRDDDSLGRCEIRSSHNIMYL
jgi:hypothetical protein